MATYAALIALWGLQAIASYLAITVTFVLFLRWNESQIEQELLIVVLLIVALSVVSYAPQLIGSVVIHEAMVTIAYFVILGCSINQLWSVSYTTSRRL